MHPRRARWAWAQTLVLVAMAAGCEVGPKAERAAWLANTVVDDNLQWLARDPGLVAQKFAKMDSGTYAFFRGTAGQFHRDMSLPQYSSAYVTSESTEVLVVGDPHLENLGTYRGIDGQLLLDWNDFDSAGYGSYSNDVRRLALSFVAATDELQPGTIDDEEVLELVGILADAYADEIGAISAGNPAMQVRPGGEFGAIVDDVLARAKKKGDAREMLEDYTEVDEAGVRRLLRGQIDEPALSFAIKELVEASPEERALVQQAMADYDQRAGRAPGLIKDVVRRLGAGVSSYAVVRYYILCEGASTSVGDDVILELKEVTNSPIAERMTGEGRRRYASNGERIVALMRDGQETPDNDLGLGYAVVEPWSFRARSVEGYQKGLDVERIAEHMAIQFWRVGDLMTVAETAGRALARAHGNSATASGLVGAVVIAKAMAGDVEGFASEVVGFIHAYRPVLRQDVELFARLLEELGPTLGYP